MSTSTEDRAAVTLIVTLLACLLVVAVLILWRLAAPQVWFGFWSGLGIVMPAWLIYAVPALIGVGILRLIFTAGGHAWPLVPQAIRHIVEFVVGIAGLIWFGGLAIFIGGFFVFMIIQALTGWWR